MTDAPTYAFGEYLFIPRRQLLLKNGKSVRIGCRALDLLEAFVKRPGEVLSKRELLEEAWPSTTVVEGNLKVHIAALRRALDDDADQAKYIATVNGRGYRFIAPVINGDTSGGSSSGAPPATVNEIDPTPGNLEGRFRDIVALLAQTMRSTVLDLPGETGQPAAQTRRVLFIELTARDDAWIEDMFARRQPMPSALQ